MEKWRLRNCKSIQHYDGGVLWRKIVRLCRFPGVLCHPFFGRWAPVTAMRCKEVHIAPLLVRKTLLTAT